MSMLNTCHNTPITINGYKITELNGGNFKAENNEIIFFNAEGRNGALYFNVTGYYNKQTKKSYQAQKYLNKYIQTVREIAFYLADNNYLWDYIEQRPFLETREEAKIKINNQRITEGKKPIY